MLVPNHYVLSFWIHLIMCNSCIYFKIKHGITILWVHVLWAWRTSVCVCVSKQLTGEVSRWVSVLQQLLTHFTILLFSTPFLLFFPFAPLFLTISSFLSRSCAAEPKLIRPQPALQDGKQISLVFLCVLSVCVYVFSRINWCLQGNDWIFEG